jgi:hypothetical protein
LASSFSDVDSEFIVDGVLALAGDGTAISEFAKHE